jgi:hypothetical protein
VPRQVLPVVPAPATPAPVPSGIPPAPAAVPPAGAPPGNPMGQGN